MGPPGARLRDLHPVQGQRARLCRDLPTSGSSGGFGPLHLAGSALLLPHWEGTELLARGQDPPDVRA